MPFQEHWKISIIIPLESGNDMNDNSIVKNIIAHFQNSASKVGNIGQYSGCYEMHAAVGGYTPEAGSQPHTGKIGESEHGSCAVFVTYGPLSMEKETVFTFCEEIAAIHPWEHPTIEIEKTLLWMPS